MTSSVTLPSVPSCAKRVARASHGDCLLFGTDPSLQRTRGMLLESSGFSCVSRNGRVDLKSLHETRFVLAVLCHTILPEDASRIAEILYARMPFTPILRLSRLQRSECAYYDRLLVQPSPGELLAAAHRLSILGILRRVRHLAECRGAIAAAANTPAIAAASIQ